MYSKQLLWICLFLPWVLGCLPKVQPSVGPVLSGAEQLETYLPLLQGKKIALVVNQASCVGKDGHLVDVLLAKNVSIQKIFAPEHGFRGDQGAGESFSDNTDPTTGITIVSLYGKTRKPTQDMLVDVDLVVFDIQDVGVRFYTYLSTLHYVMEACAAYQKPLVVLDRPNPNGHYVDGPILNPQFQSFVGKHPIPIVYGLTIGELALMINGEGWLQAQLQCDLRVIPLKNYTHPTPYSLPIKPSPNLPNEQAIALYPSLGLFEGTIMSIGRGTPLPFQVIGYPEASFGEFQFTPVSIPDQAKQPKYQDQLCYGVDLRQARPLHQINLQYLLHFHQLATARGLSFFGNTFDLHAGSDLLRQQIQEGLTETAIRASWQKDLAQYKAKREQYLLYR